METVELRPAYTWDCNACGQENFARAIVIEMSVEDARKIREDVFGDPEDKGFFFGVPKCVACVACGEVFMSGIYNEMEDDDDIIDP